jgi:hypothetical protein
MLRKCLCIEEKQIRIIVLKILRYTIELKPNIAYELKAKLFPLVISKFFEDFRHGTFEERFEVNINYFKIKSLFIYLFFFNQLILLNKINSSFSSALNS